MDDLERLSSWNFLVPGDGFAQPVKATRWVSTCGPFAVSTNKMYYSD
jgi:hypothetical protein